MLRPAPVVLARPRRVLADRGQHRAHTSGRKKRWIRHASEREEPAARGYEEVLEELALARAGDRRVALYPALAGRVHLDARGRRGPGRRRARARAPPGGRPGGLPRGAGPVRGLDPGAPRPGPDRAQGRALGRRRGPPEERDRRDRPGAGARSTATPTLRELIFGRPRPRRPDALSAYPTEQERRDLLADQLALSETWGYNQPEGAGYGLPAEGLSGTQLLRRFRDRIGLERAYLRLARELASGTDRRAAFSTFVATIERDVLAREGDLVEAYLARAQGRREVGDLDGAISDLSFLTANPLLRRNASLAQGLADVRAQRDLDQAEEAAERWMQDPDSGALRSALDHLDSFFERGTADRDRLAQATPAVRRPDGRLRSAQPRARRGGAHLRPLAHRAHPRGASPRASALGRPDRGPRPPGRIPMSTPPDPARADASSGFEIYERLIAEAGRGGGTSPTQERWTRGRPGEARRGPLPAPLPPRTPAPCPGSSAPSRRRAPSSAGACTPRPRPGEPPAPEPRPARIAGPRATTPARGAISGHTPKRPTGQRQPPDRAETEP